MSTRTRRWLLAAALAVAAMPSLAATAAAPPQCLALAVSPQFAKDRTVACYTIVNLDASRADIRVHVSRDGMRTWRQAAATGFSPSRMSNPTQLFFVGGTLFFQVSDQGLLFSDDLGETFRVADPMGGSPNGRDNLTAVPAATVPLPDIAGFPRVEIAYGDNLPDRESMIRPPLHQRVVASRDTDLRFAAYLTPDGARRWLTASQRRSPYAATVWDCDATLACTDERGVIPGENSAFDVTVAPDFGRSGVVFVTTEDTRPGAASRLKRLWRSTDGGRTFTEVAPVAQFRRGLRTPHGELATGVSFVGGRTVVLRLEFDDTFAAAAAPVRQIHVSNDLGASWRLVAFGRSAQQRGPRGTLPWGGMAGMTAHERGRVHAVGGRLFLLADVRDARRPFCSRDLGRTWAASC